MDAYIPRIYTLIPLCAAAGTQDPTHPEKRKKGGFFGPRKGEDGSELFEDSSELFLLCGRWKKKERKTRKKERNSSLQLLHALHTDEKQLTTVLTYP